MISGNLKQSLPAWLLLSCATLLTYATVVHNRFVTFDDLDFLFKNPHVSGGLSVTNVLWALTGTYQANWYPLTWISHMADITLFGASPAGHHLMNLALHTLNVLLLQLLLQRLTGSVWRSAAVAALFALHPLQVESVAWAAERKNVLSTLFFLLTLLAYHRYTRIRSLPRYVVMLALYICGLASKPMLVTLPVLLLLLDIWPLGRLDSGVDKLRGILVLVREKLVLFLLAVASGIITIVLQTQGGSIKGTGAGSLIENILHTPVNYVKYLFLAFRPVDLAVLYPYVRDLPWWQPLGAAMLLLGITVLAARLWPQRPQLAFGWCWFLVSLAPVAGFIRIGAHSIADRYMYLPVIGLAIAVVWTGADLLSGVRHGPVTGIAVAVLVCGSLAVASAKQLAYWRDSVTLFAHAIAVTRDNWLANNNISVELVQRGEFARASRHVREAIRINPRCADAYYNIGKIHANLGENREAIKAFEKTIALDPEYADAYLKLITIHLETGNKPAAMAAFQALRLVDRTRAFPGNL